MFEDTFEGIGWTCKVEQRQGCPHLWMGGGLGGTQSTCKSAFIVRKNSKLVPLCYIGFQIKLHLILVFKLPGDTLSQADTNSRRFQHLQLWFETKQHFAGACKNLMIRRPTAPCHLFFLEIGKARDGVSFRQLKRTCTTL